MYQTKISYFLAPNLFCWRMQETVDSSMYAIEKCDGMTVAQIGTATVEGLIVGSVSLVASEKWKPERITTLLQEAIRRGGQEAP